MFILTTISDLVQISPEDFQKPSAESIEDNLNAKYANKVVQKIGLCICVYDILSASDGLIGHGTGIVNVNVECRLVVFRPFKGEIVAGRISSASDDGMRIALDFFDDIFVPSNLLFPDSTFNEQEQCWVWSNEGQEYFYDKTDWVRFRVEQEHWTDLSPLAPSLRETGAYAERKSPYSITASMMQAGLGPVQSSNHFPVLDAGDIEIWLTRKPKDRLLLHSVVLSLHSKWFNASLSERWTGGSSKSLDHVAKWRYELEFEDEKTATLVKGSDSLHTVTSLSADTTDDLYFNSNGFSSAHLDKKQRKHRVNLVKAYRCYFGAVFHLPIDYDYDSSKWSFEFRVRDFIAMIVEIGDFYDGLQFLTGPVENLLKTFVVEYPFNLSSCLKILPQMSLKLRSGWLFKEVVCELAGQHYCNDGELRNHLPPEMASLVLKKWAWYRQMMRDLNNEILTLENPDYDVGEDPDVIQIASSWYRQFIFMRLFKCQEEIWFGIPYKYRTLVVCIPSIDYDTELRHYYFKSQNQRSSVYGLLRSMLDKASQKIRHSFGNDSAWFQDDFDRLKSPKCITVHDEELPWNGC
ncbi:MAG: hypothetical protein Q9198_001938 [Flavoplaca austrocitrina]